MRLLEKGAPAAAIVAALSTHFCCIPLGFLPLVGVTSARVAIQPLRLWLLGASAMLLCVGFVTLYFRKSSCVRHSTTSLVFFWAAVAVVFLTVFFPQVIPSFIAG